MISCPRLEWGTRVFIPITSHPHILLLTTFGLDKIAAVEHLLFSSCHAQHFTVWAPDSQMVERTTFVTAEDKNMESDPNINELIPPEVLLQVLEQLPPRSLLSAVLVCRLWLDLAHQAPQLWTWVHLTGWLQLASMFSVFSLAARPLLGLSSSKLSPVCFPSQVCHPRHRTRRPRILTPAEVQQLFCLKVMAVWSWFLCAINFHFDSV